MTAKFEIQFEIKQAKATIDLIQVLDEGAHLSFSASGSLSLADYFGPGGEGHESSVSIQTIEGRIDILIAASAVCLTHDTVTVKVPPTDRPILKNITEGTRFIFAIHRPAKGE